MGTQQGVLQTFEYASKLTQLKDYPIGVMTWSTAALGSRSVQSLIMEHEHALNSMGDNVAYTVEGLAQGLVDFLRNRYDQAFPVAGGNRPNLGIYIGGFSAGDFFSTSFVYTFPTSNALERVHPDNADGVPMPSPLFPEPARYASVRRCCGSSRGGRPSSQA